MTGSYLRQLVFPLALLMLFPACPVNGAQPLCLRCHQPHFVTYGRCSVCHRGNELTDRTSLAHSSLIAGNPASFLLPSSPVRERGRKLADLLSCRRCHILEGKGNPLAANLDRVSRSASVSQLSLALQKPALYMPDFHLSSASTDDLVTYLLFAGNRGKNGGGAETPLQIHFAAGSEQTDIFSRRCGGCHQMLQPLRGGLGQGRGAPNLSGLLGEFYPHTYQGRLPWTAERLTTWLANPRKVKPEALMQPVQLTEKERADLLRLLTPVKLKPDGV